MRSLRLALLFDVVLSVTLFAQSLEIGHFFNSANRCDYLIITPRIFSEGALRLAQYRNGFDGDDVVSAGYVVFEKLLAEFSRPELAPDTIVRESISWALKNWELPPSYIVLLGSDSAKIAPGDSIPKNRGPMPTHIDGPFRNRDGDHYDTTFEYIDDWYLKTCIDSIDTACHRYCIDPPIALGRIPCEQQSDINRYLQKVQRYESLRPAPWRNRIFVTMDDNIQNGEVECSNFASCLDSNRNFFAGRSTIGLFFSDYSGNASAAKETFFTHVNNGAEWTIYYGHGWPRGLAYEQIVVAEDYTRFRNTDMPTIFFSYGCNNGAFYVPAAGSMCKRFLFTIDGGAVAYIANPNLGSGDFATFINDIIRLHDSIPNLSIGKLVARAKNGECLSSNYWEVLGDPALREVMRVASLSMQRIGNTILECATQTDKIRDGALSWEITQGREWYDPLCQTFERRDSIIVSGTAELVNGVCRIVVPSLPKSNLLRITAYAWNDSFESRGAMNFSKTDIEGQLTDNTKRRLPRLSAASLPSAAILFTLGSSQKVSATIDLFDLLGRRIQTITIPYGASRILWNCNAIASGTYLACLHIGSIPTASVFIHRP